ncbi:CRISPR-associated endonuclease Cas2, partial [Candidatus Bathyarchaeota archaeon]
GEIEKIKIGLKKIINENEDSIILYKARNKKWITKEILGTEKSETTTII